MKRQIIPNDNACLFTSIDFLLEGEFRAGAAAELRKMCADHIRQDPNTFTETYLGRSPDEYCTWILEDFSWGGEIEIEILSELKEIHISVVPLETLRILTYGPMDAAQSHGRIYMLYTGQYYDALVADDGKTVFANETSDCSDSQAIECASQHKATWEELLRTRLRKRIKCLGCRAILLNASDFQQHCMSVEHEDEFCFECEEIEITEMVESPDDD